jgi:hypothetical protein
MPTKLDTVQIPIVWIGLDDATIGYANQVICQMGAPDHPGEFILTFGQLHPPVLLGGPESNRLQLQSLSFVPVRVVAKLALNEARLRELQGALVTILKSYDDVVAATRAPARRKRR